MEKYIEDLPVAVFHASSAAHAFE